MGGVITDSVADMLTRIRNASAARHDTVKIPGSRLKAEIARILKEEGFITEFKRLDERPQGALLITLRYGARREPILTGIRRVSRPGLRIYSRRTEIPRVRGGLGVVIVSTSRGVMTDRQARRQGVGGEILAYIW
ncbi:MAG: 30S ribosomal protein S8 [bacterium]